MESHTVCLFVACLFHLTQLWSPAFLVRGTSFMEDHFSHGPVEGRDGFGMTQAHYTKHITFIRQLISLLLPVIHNEIIIQLLIMWNQWEP